MKRIHPITNGAAAWAAVFMFVGLAGCRTQSGAGVNPFLAPNRVPPPSTRALQPGEARPYYPGDAVPVMQSDAGDATQTSGLAWAAPAKNGPTGQIENKPPIASPNAFTERIVAIPPDKDDLRFAPNVAPVESVEQAALMAAQNPALPQPPQVIPAAYYEPTSNFAPAPAPIAWQTPQLAVPNEASVSNPLWPVIAPLQTVLAAAPPNNAAAPMDVRLRAVPSPPPEAGYFATPRIRLPGYPVPATANANDGFRPRSSMR